MKTDKRLVDLLAHHEQAAAALRTTIALLSGGSHGASNGASNGHASNGHAAVLGAALHLDAARRRRTRPAETVGTTLARRRASATFLDRFDRKTPRRQPGTRLLSPLLIAGYLKRKGTGYVRTAKPFNPEKVQKKSSTAAREQTAALLATFDLHDPRPIPAGLKRIGPYVHAGYVKAKGDGWVRTAKAFTV